MAKLLQSMECERAERSFAHVCETGGARRTWLCGFDKVRKRYLISAVARNLGLILRAAFGIGTARSLQKGWGEAAAAVCGLLSGLLSVIGLILALSIARWRPQPPSARLDAANRRSAAALS